MVVAVGVGVAVRVEVGVAVSVAVGVVVTVAVGDAVTVGIGIHSDSSLDPWPYWPPKVTPNQDVEVAV